MTLGLEFSLFAHPQSPPPHQSRASTTLAGPCGCGPHICGVRESVAMRSRWVTDVPAQCQPWSRLPAPSPSLRETKTLQEPLYQLVTQVKGPQGPNSAGVSAVLPTFSLPRWMCSQVHVPCCSFHLLCRCHPSVPHLPPLINTSTQGDLSSEFFVDHPSPGVRRRSSHAPLPLEKCLSRGWITARSALVLGERTEGMALFARRRLCPSTGRPC